MGLLCDGPIYPDASAALGIVQRRGIGEVRHIRTQSLWLREAHATMRLDFEKIDGSRNPSHLMTKHLTDTLKQRHLTYINAVPTVGRAKSAPAPSNLEVEDDRYFLATIQVESPPVILKVYEGEIGKGDEGSGLVSSTFRDAPVSQNACDSAARVRHARASRFHP